MIDVNYNFTSEIPEYWDGYWDRNNGLGGGGTFDPDACSKTLKEYHRILWSKKLPNGDQMELSDSLAWDGIKYGSDSIIVSFRYKNFPLAEQLKTYLPDYKKYFGDYISKSNTIPGYIIFPRHQNSINQRRGTDLKIRDRWDLTMECIRRYYSGEESPLSNVMKNDRKFFELFVDFKGYVDYFMLQDCVSNDCRSVDIWLGDGELIEDGLPKSVEEYLSFIDKEMIFLEKRRKRIQEFCINNKI